MENELRDILVELDRPNTEQWLPIMKLGKPVYDFVLSLIVSKQLNERQMVNGLQVLFRLRSHGDQTGLAELLIRETKNPSIAIRSEALKLIIGWAKLRCHYPMLCPENLERSAVNLIVTDSISRSVYPHVYSLAIDFLAKDGYRE